MTLATGNQDGILVTGAAGSGRLFVAQAIHHASSDDREGVPRSMEYFLRRAMRPVRSDQPFVVIDCGRGLALESELFGEPGPSPFAQSRGLDELVASSPLWRAAKGTMVFRHLPELPTRLQFRLAKVFKDGEAIVRQPDGDRRVETLSVRLMATADVDPQDHVVADFYKRVADVRIQVPKLQERRDDIPALVRYLLMDLAADSGEPAKSISNQAVELLAALPWQGNITELRDLLRALIVRAPRPLICLSDVLAHVRLNAASTQSYMGTLREARERFEQEYVQMVLKQHHGRMSDAAKALGLQRSNLYRKIRQLSVSRRRYDSAMS